jgi:sec-independent protein translocase protein TatC
MAKDDLFDEESGMVRMTFGEHLEDLRRRLILAILGFIPGLAIGLYIGKDLVTIMSAPVKSALLDFYRERRDERRAELQKKRAEGEELTSETLRVMVDRDSFRKAVVQAFPEIKPAGSGESPPQPAAQDESSTAAGGEPVELVIRVIHEELEMAAERDFPSSALMTIGPQEAFMAYLKVSIVAGLVLASWWIIYQLWQFVAEGLYANEKSIVRRAMPLSASLFIIGVVFCFVVVLPVVMNFFFGINRWLDIEPNIRLTEWLGFATLLPLIFGVCFELPLVMFVLEAIGLFKIDDYIQRWRHAILVIAVVAMVVTPTTDPGSMMLLMGPMAALYFLGIGLVWLRHGGLRTVGPVGKLRIGAALLAIAYTVGVGGGLVLPASWIDRDWWFAAVWKPATLPLSFVFRSKLDLASAGWIWLVTLLNATVIGVVVVRLGEVLLRLRRKSSHADKRPA